jgi:hypothetical protein
MNEQSLSADAARNQRAWEARRWPMEHIWRVRRAFSQF